MKAVFHEDARLHHPRIFLVNGVITECPEVPERCDVLLRAARQAGHESVAPEDRGPGPIAAVHTAQYLQFLQHIHVRWQRIEGASAEVLPNIHPDHRGAGLVFPGESDDLLDGHGQGFCRYNLQGGGDAAP